MWSMFTIRRERSRFIRTMKSICVCLRLWLSRTTCRRGSTIRWWRKTSPQARLRLVNQTSCDLSAAAPLARPRLSDFLFCLPYPSVLFRLQLHWFFSLETDFFSFEWQVCIKIVTCQFGNKQFGLIIQRNKVDFLSLIISEIAHLLNYAWRNLVWMIG